MMVRRTLFSIAVIVFGNVGLAHGEIIARQVVEKEVVVRDADGRETLQRQPAETVAPGEEVIYTLAFDNDGADAANDVVLVMPVPDEIAYMEGSVSGENALVTFSADGGASYVARGRLTVSENGSARPARSDEITHIRWVIAELPAGGEGAVSFRGILK